MPQMSSKVVQAETAHTQRSSAAGSNGAALSPPAYGIDFVDRQVERENNTGLPDHLKAGIENLSGMAMDDVRVHYHSSKPAQLQALAYTQGTDIFMGPGQEQHLPHEAWHVVQQKEGRVRATVQMVGVQVNDEDGLEREADVMGAKALSERGFAEKIRHNPTKGNAIQLAKQKGDKDGDKKKTYDAAATAKLLAKLRSTYSRNLIRKAHPKRYRKIWQHQKEQNYGYKNKTAGKITPQGPSSQALVPFNPTMDPSIKPDYQQFSFSGMSGYYRQGWGGQPFLYLQKRKYDDKMMESDYDAIIGKFGGKDAEIAFQLLSIIESGVAPGADILGQAKSLFVFLTQIIEAHSTRIPGSDKLARALLRRITLGQLTFQQAFNRKNGLFVSAWGTKSGAPQGGQVAARALFGISKAGDNYGEAKLEKDLVCLATSLARK
jgi:hypothetical protein